MDAVTEKTPCGRIPGTPLRNRQHEAVVHATVRGKNARDAGLEAEYADGPGLDGNVTRLLHRPDVRERLAEVAAKSGELAHIYDAWILADLKLFRAGSVAHFWRRDDEGRIALDDEGLPKLDFSNATEEQIRCLSELSYGKHGPKIKIHDPKGFLEMLGRHRGLWKDTLPLGDLFNAPIEIRLVKPEGDERKPDQSAAK